MAVRAGCWHREERDRALWMATSVMVGGRQPPAAVATVALYP